MGWKEERDQRRDELFEQFVSVESLIEEIAGEFGIDEAADEFMSRHREADDSDLPQFGPIDDSNYKFNPLANAFQHREVLYEMLEDTVEGCVHGDRSDHYGWLRKDLFTFLQKIGMDVPVYLPAWKPQDAPIPKPTVLTSSEKPLGSKERNTLLCVIAALLDQQGIEFYRPERGTARRIEEWVSGVGASVSEETIKGVLDKLNDAVSARATN